MFKYGNKNPHELWLRQHGIVSYAAFNKQMTSGENAINSTLLENRLTLLEEQVAALKKTNVVPVTATATLSVNQTSDDVVISASEEVVTGKASISAKSIDVKSLNADSSTIDMKATGDITIQSLCITGDLPKSTANAQVKINTEEYVKVTNSVFEQTGYNAVEIGLSNAPKSVIIDGLTFDATLQNNAILIFQHQDDAVITISNCHFANVSNPIRISNKLNKKATVNIINCTIDRWETGAPYQGLLLMQDYTSNSTEAELENNLFAPEKITINLVNVVGPNGKITEPSDMATICGSGDASQVMYVYGNKGGVIPYGDGSRYPTVTFK